jgi:hypothetical protein
VTVAYKTDSEQLNSAKTERDALLQAALAALQAKQEPGTGEKKKISDSEVNKKVEAEHPGRLSKLNAQIKTLEARVRLHEPKAEAFFGSSRSKTKTHILGGGELARPGAEVKPGFVEAMLPAGAAVPANYTRGELARWLTAPEHPLTARVLVNRLWQHHFGAGLVSTPSDFGRNGRRPTHPELLDWLARRFVSDGYSLKKMHRLIMTSETYRRSSQANPSALSKDPENKLLWRMNRRRLEAEAIRDTVLTVSGLLNPVMGGPGVYAKLPKGVNVEFPNNDKELSWGASTPAEDARRSIYLFQRRTLTYPFMDVFDAAPMNQSCPARAQTTVAPQALALFNGEFAREAAGHFAERLLKEAGSKWRSQVERGFQLAFTRPPTQSELNTALQFLQDQTSIRKNGSAPDQAALQDFCHALLNANEMLYID